MGDRLGEEESEKAPKERKSAFTCCRQKGSKYHDHQGICGSESPHQLKDDPSRPPVLYTSAKISESKPRLSDSKHSVYTTDSDSSAMEPLLTKVKSMSDLENTECLTYEMVRRRARRKKFKCEVGSEGSGNIQNTTSPRPHLTHDRCSKSPICGVAPSMKSSLSAMSELSEYLDEGPSTSFEQMKKSTELSEKMSTSLGASEINQNHHNCMSTSVISDASEKCFGGVNPPLMSPIFSPLSPPAVCRPISNYSSQHTDRCVSPLVSESKVKVKIVHRPISSRPQDPESKISILQIGQDKVQTVFCGYDPPQTRADKKKLIKNTNASNKITTGLVDEKIAEVLDDTDAGKNISQDHKSVTTADKSN